MDDWLLVNKDRQKLQRQLNEMLKLVAFLGFIVNIEKSELTPAKTFIYLGPFFNLSRGLVAPSQGRLVKLKDTISIVLIHIRPTPTATWTGSEKKLYKYMYIVGV